MTMTDTAKLALALGMKGYWIEGDGVLRVSWERPTFWQRVLAWVFLDSSWVDYK